MENDRGFNVFIGKDRLLYRFDKCGYHYVESGLETRYPLEVACITSNFDKINDYAVEGWPSEIAVAMGRMN